MTSKDTPSALTVLLRLREGSEEALREVLLAIGDDVRGRRLKEDGSAPFVDFARTRTHFARFAVLPDPDAGPGRHRLLFAVVHDGPRAGYLAELAGATRHPDAIWGACEGYAGPESLSALLESHTVETEAFYRAFPNQSVEEVRRMVEIVRALETGIDEGRFPYDLEPPGGSALVSRVAQILRFILRAPAWSWDALRVIGRYGLGHTVAAGLEITASLDRIRTLRWTNRLTGNRMPPVSTPHSERSLDECRPCTPLGARDEVVDPGLQWRMRRRREDRVAQNQLTLVTVNDPARVPRLAAVLAAIGLYSRRLAPPGSLVGISTIHFVRWAVIDEGRRLIMISDYDGSWEAYIDEFAELILSGLDAIWSGSVGYPENGARDLQAFKSFLRCRQFQAEVFYSGYPEDTVLNLIEHRRGARWRERTLERLGHG